MKGLVQSLIKRFQYYSKKNILSNTTLEVIQKLPLLVITNPKNPTKFNDTN